MEGEPGGEALPSGAVAGDAPGPRDLREWLTLIEADE